MRIKVKEHLSSVDTVYSIVINENAIEFKVILDVFEFKNMFKQMKKIKKEEMR